MRVWCALIALWLGAGVSLAVLPAHACDDSGADDSAQELLAGLSPVMEHIARAVLPVADEGTVDPDLILTRHNYVTPRVFTTGPTMLEEKRELDALFARAEYEIGYQTWDWQAGDLAADSILGAIKNLERVRAEQKRQGEPVVVRILVNVMPFRSASYVPDIAKSIGALDLDPSLVRVELGAWRHTLLGANHSKHVVIDGSEAVLTGANTNDNYAPAPSNLDAGFHLAGEAALALRSDFVDAWSHADRWICGPRSPRWIRRGKRRVRENCYGDTDPIPDLPAWRGVVGDVPVLAVSHRAHGWPWHRSYEHPLAQAFIAGVYGAHDHVHIMTPNLNDPVMRSAIVSAVRRGRSVDVIVSKKFEAFAQSLPTRGGTNARNVERLYDALAEAGVENPCERLDIRWFSRDGVHPVEKSAGPPASHTKYMSIDSQVAIVGSANQDIQSYHNSREVDAVIDDAKTAQTWDAQLFAPHFARAIPVSQCGGQAPVSQKGQ